MDQPTYWTELDSAMHAVVHDYGKRGATDLGPLVGIPPSTLSNKVNPNVESTSLFVSEAIRVQTVAKDFRILHAEAALLNHIAIPVMAFDGVADMELLEAYAAWTAEIGETAQAIVEALNHQYITQSDLCLIRQEIHQDARRAFALLARLESLAE